MLVAIFQSIDDLAKVCACRHEKRHHSKHRKDTKAGQQEAKRARWPGMDGDDNNPDSVRSQRVCQTFKSWSNDK